MEHGLSPEHRETGIKTQETRATDRPVQRYVQLRTSNLR